MRNRRTLAAVLALTVSAILPSTAVAAPPHNGPCNLTQFLDNSWVTRQSPVVSSADGWIKSVQGWINRYDYSLCTQGILKPIVTGTGAWIAIEGSPGAENIIQMGYWKCDYGCINNMPRNKLTYFYAYGQTGDPFHLPRAIPIPGESGSAHTFKIQLHYTGGTRQWEFLIDGTIRVIIDDEWRSWNRNKVEVATENWNCGDQMGGRNASGSDPGNKQKFRDIVWVNNTTHNGGLGNPFAAGNPYPWAYFQRIDSSDFDVWTSAHTSGGCAA